MSTISKNLQSNEWTRVDFLINKAFWTHWGHDAAIPLRIRNLADLQSLFRRHNIPCSLYGSTFLQAQRGGTLQPDHDDDICIATETTQVESISRDFSEEGFTIIRSNPSMYSFERFGRYVDAHLVSATSFPTTVIRVNGTDLQALPLDHEIISKWAASKKISRKSCSQSGFQKAIDYLRRVESPRDAAKLLKRVINRFFYNLSRLLREVRNPHVKIGLSKVEFLALRIDDPGALNWFWRGDHWREAFRPGESFGEALRRYSEEGTPRGESQVLQSPVLEPVHLSRSFWKNGSDNLASQLRHGFKHQVIPYQASNIYLVNGLEPPLFSDDYFSELPNMTDDEVASFLRDHPVEVSKIRNLSSGRHRATAMVGHLLQGRPYVKVYARCSLPTSAAILSARVLRSVKPKSRPPVSHEDPRGRSHRCHN